MLSWSMAYGTPSQRRIAAVLLSSALALRPARARADRALCGPELVRLLGDHALHVLAPKSELLGALVTLPEGQTAEALGLEPFAPGYARLHARPGDLVAYGSAHPELQIEVAPPLHALLDKAGLWIRSHEAHESGFDGSGVLVGVADTGLDVSLADFRDPVTGKSRVAWILDLSLPPAGLYPELESQYCIKATDGTCQLGAVLQGKDIDSLLADHSTTSLPIDEYGHGTHVTSIAAGNGGPEALYVGAAPGAGIVFARVVRQRSDVSYTIQNDDILTGVSFIFGRAQAMNLPIAVNISLGTDFGPHDGSLSWEKALASYVGEQAPGRALAVAAGNSGSIALTPIHQTVYLPSDGEAVSVPIPTPGSANGDVQVWITFTAGSSISVGLDGPDGTWIDRVPPGQTANDDGGGYTASIVNGSAATCAQPVDGSCQLQGAAIPSGSNGAIVIWDANGEGSGWPSGSYAITLQGSGTADLWLSSDVSGVGFEYGVREGTINLPATQPGIVAVGCTINRTSWKSLDDGVLDVPPSPELDPVGGLAVDAGADSDAGAAFVLGEPCWFSSAGPTVTGVPKPEISAPGSYVVGAMSSAATPPVYDENDNLLSGSAESIFSSYLTSVTPYQSVCPPVLVGGPPDPTCYEVDPTHAIAQGTSMSAPMVTGAIAVLFQRDPTLTQDQIVPILQGGAHYFRSGSEWVQFEDQDGPGELDVEGSLAVIDLMRDPLSKLPGTASPLPSAEKSWLTLSTDYVLADGATPTVAIVELRTVDAHAADLFAASRLKPRVLLDGAPFATPTLIRRGPGVWSYSIQPPPGLGGGAMTFGATFDGQPIVESRTIPVATDPWTADYPSEVGGGGSCSVASPIGARTDASWWLVFLSGIGTALALGRQRSRRIQRDLDEGPRAPLRPAKAPRPQR
jgi:hypothetical protein